MATVFDVAKYILHKHGETTAMKLQKLVYYAQAWSLVWDEQPLFNEPIKAWANGPVVPVLYDSHRGMFMVSEAALRGRGAISNLSARQKTTIDKVLEFYGKKTAQWLSDLTHIEEPWKQAREGHAPGARSNNEITHASMHEYYSGL